MVSHAEICKLLGVNPNTLATWIKLGHITPKEYYQKQRVSNYFDEENLRQIQILQNMVKSGIKRGLAKKLMEKTLQPNKLKNGKLRYSFTFTIDIEDNYEI